jgi:hypothetical protein
MKLNPWPKKYATSLRKLYEDAGVNNRSTKAKKAYWLSLEPNTTVTHVETDAHWVRVLELSWVADQFPTDFPHC